MQRRRAGRTRRGGARPPRVRSRPQGRRLRAGARQAGVARVPCKRTPAPPRLCTPCNASPPRSPAPSRDLPRPHTTSHDLPFVRRSLRPPSCSLAVPGLHRCASAVDEFEEAIDKFESETAASLESVARGTSVGVALELREALALRSAAIEVSCARRPLAPTAARQRVATPVDGRPAPPRPYLRSPPSSNSRPALPAESPTAHARRSASAASRLSSTNSA